MGGERESWRAGGREGGREGGRMGKSEDRCEVGGTGGWRVVCAISDQLADGVAREAARHARTLGT